MSGKNNAQHIGALAVAAIGTAAVAYFPLAAGNYGTYLANLTGVFLIAAIGLNITMGYAGQISLAHAAFMGIGAYTAALMMKGGLSFWLALPCSALMAGIFGFGLGFPALKVRRHYLAMVTLGFTMLFYQVARNEAWLTGGVAGLRDIPRPALLGRTLELDGHFFYVIAVCVAVASLFYWWLVSSRWGRAFRAMRENEMRAEALGISLRNYKTMAFAIGAAYAGVAGALLATLLRYIDPTPFTLDRSLSFLIMVAIGGPGWFAGPLVGAAIVTLLPELLRGAQSLYMMVFAALLLLMLLFAPRGIVPYLAAAARSLRTYSSNLLVQWRSSP